MKRISRRNFLKAAGVGINYRLLIVELKLKT